MQKHIHGGNIYTYQNCIDFSANCNPLGTAPGVKEAIRQSLDQLADYPRVGCLPLRTAIAAWESGGGKAQKADPGHDSVEFVNGYVFTPDQIICGNGAAEVIFSLCRAAAPKRALLPAPTFAEYEQALRSVGCEIEYFMLPEENGFRITEAFPESLHENLDIVFLCNPNNPTGALTDREFLFRVLERCEALGIRLVLDECFLDFVQEPEAYTMKAALKTHQNLFILKAFTKRYAMAGVRLGYGISSDRGLLEKMEGMTQPWNVSTLAQNAGMAALKETEYVEQGRQIVFREREYLCREMRSLGLTVFEPQANYLFFRGPETLFENCLERGILIRDCSNYAGLEKGYFRIAVKQQEENKKLITVLKDILKKIS